MASKFRVPDYKHLIDVLGVPTDIAICNGKKPDGHECYLVSKAGHQRGQMTPWANPAWPGARAVIHFDTERGITQSGLAKLSDVLGMDRAIYDPDSFIKTVPEVANIAAAFLRMRFERKVMRTAMSYIEPKLLAQHLTNMNAYLVNPTTRAYLWLTAPQLFEFYKEV